MKFYSDKIAIQGYSTSLRFKHPMFETHMGSTTRPPFTQVGSIEFIPAHICIVGENIYPLIQNIKTRADARRAFVKAFKLLMEIYPLSIFIIFDELRTSAHQEGAEMAQKNIRMCLGLDY